jgi:hypothetical protein
MKSTRWLFRSLGGTASLIIVGCWTPAPYGYGTYPGNYGPPPQGFAAPPGTIVQPGVTYPTPQLGPPGSPGNGPTWQQAPALSPTPANSGPLTPLPGAPPQSFDSGPSTFRGPTVGARRQSDIPVPDPIDPGPRVSPGPAPPRGPAPTDQNTSPFGSEGEKSFDRGTQMQVPKRGDDGPQSVAAAGLEPFEPPLERDGKPDSGVVAVAAKTADGKTPSDSRNRYDYDRTSYSYLRGVLDFNSRDNTWNIIYSPKPDPRDKYGGSFQLVDSPKLKTLHDGDVVFMQGRVNLQQLDSRGKPKYEIGDEVARITYRGSQAVGN